MHAYKGVGGGQESFWYNGPEYHIPINAGTWYQIEQLYIPNTSYTSDAWDKYGPPYPCTSPTQDWEVPRFFDTFSMCSYNKNI
jgi:hypothetical protein